MLAVSAMRQMAQWDSCMPFVLWSNARPHCSDAGLALAYMRALPSLMYAGSMPQISPGLLGRHLGHPLGQLLEAVAPVLHEVVVVQVFLE